MNTKSSSHVYASQFFSQLIGILVFIIISTGITFGQDGFVIDHNCSDLDDIPEEWIAAAKSNLHIAYNHTSHGSQLMTGIKALRDFPAFGTKYDWEDNSNGTSDFLSLDDRGISGASNDLSQGDNDSDGNGLAAWADGTYNFLDNSDNYHINVILWSWCNISGHNIPLYLHSMDSLITMFGEGGTHPRAAEHPVKFVYITAHANGGGEGDSSDEPNEAIRDHVAANPDRILFDFSDLENYNPDEEYFLDKLLSDDLTYDTDNNGSRDGNWGEEYITTYDNSELDQLTTGDDVDNYNGCESCAHSNSGANHGSRLNCILKGRAAWNMFARLAGWNGNSAMPVTWVSPVNAKIKNTNAIVEWTVAEQYNNDKFIIEHSTNSLNFLSIGEIDVKNDQNLYKTYRYTHPKPVIGNNYYRVKQVDIDGSYSYSDIAHVNYDKGNKLSCYPNPSDGDTQIFSSSKDVLKLFDTKGKLVEKIILTKGVNSIDLNNLPPGIYIADTQYNTPLKIIINR